MADDKRVKATVLGTGKAKEPDTSSMTPSKQINLGKWAYDECRCVPPILDPEVLAQLYSRSTPHKACVDAKTANCVGLGWKLDPKEGEKAEDVEEKAREVKEWLEACARRDDKTFTELLTAMRKDEESVGWGAMEITRAGSGKIDGFFHIHAFTLRRRVDKDGWVQRYQGEYVYFLQYGKKLESIKDEAQRKLFETSNQILVIGETAPDSPYYPVPDEVPALGDITADETAQAYQNQFYLNNAVPRIAIVVEGGHLDEDTKAFVLDYLREGLRGEDQKVLLLETETGDNIKVRIEKLTLQDKEDSVVIEARNQHRDFILMAHRVSPSKVTIVENANLANSKDQDKTFKEQVIRPDQERYEERIQWLIEEQFGSDIKVIFHFNEMDIADKLQLAQVDNIYLKSMTNNEVREKAGLPPAGKDSITGKTEDPELEAWGKKPAGSGLTPSPLGGGGMLPDGSMPLSGDEGEILSVTSKRLAAEHQEFAVLARELGYIVESIREQPAATLLESVMKGMRDEAFESARAAKAIGEGL